MDTQDLVIVRGTTPIIECLIPDDIPLSEATEAWVSIGQGGALVVDKSLSQGTAVIDGQTLSIALTQEETLKFKTYTQAVIGVRLLLNGTDALASLNQSNAPSMDSCSYEADTTIDIQDVIKGGVIT